jgi:N-acetylmuramic acid 6-phosphate etherase
LTEASGAGEAACQAELASCDGDLRLALLCLLSGLAPQEARPALAAARGSVRAALDAAGGAIARPGAARQKRTGR